MFKQLERRMLILNLSVLTILMVAVFGTLYMILYSSVNTRIEEELEKIVVFNQFDLPQHFPNNNPEPGDFDSDRTVSFVIYVDEDSTIIESYAQFATSPTFFIDAMNQAIDDEGRFELDGSVWAYIAREVDNGTIYAFTDISAEVAVLQALLTRFIVIFVIVFALLSAISIFFVKRSIRPVKESFKKQQQFIADASHELKTPLTVINTNLDVLETQEQSDQKWLEYIRSEVDRMNSLTHSLLYLAAVTEMEKKSIIKTTFNGSELIESMLLSTDALAYEKEINIDYDLDPNVEITFNKEQFQQVMMILIDNAIKYTNKQGHVKVTLHQKASNTTIEVTNTGNGIPEDEQEMIFERFYKGDKSRIHTENSFGLGLSIAKTIVDNHDGKLSVDSVVGEYTTFIIRLKK